jgi:hypothetical protein
LGGGPCSESIEVSAAMNWGLADGIEAQYLGEKSCRSLFSVPFSVSPVIENQLRNAGNKGGKMKRKVYLILAGVDEGKNHGI